MSTSDIRHRLHEYIQFADEKKIKAIYLLVEDEIKEKQDSWSKELIQELERRSKELETGKVKGISSDEVSKKVRSIIKKH
jgi:hypothetical protein